MAFISMFIVYTAIVLIFLTVSTILGGILLIVAQVMKEKQKTKAIQEHVYHKKYRYTTSVYVLRVIGIICLLPVIGMVLLISYGLISYIIESNTSLAYNVRDGNFERVEKILERGVTPDCTLESNKPAKEGEETLLVYLSSLDEDAYSEMTREEQLQMMELLLKYGADIEHRISNHEEDYSEHSYETAGENSYYYSSDECGYTPLLCAVRNGDYEKVKFLAEHGADVNVKDYCGFNAVATIADNLTDERGLETLRYMIDQGTLVCDETKFKQQTIFLCQRQNMTENDEICREIEEAYGYTWIEE